ncbi:MAG: response regulator [Halopseudomonas sp.]
MSHMQASTVTAPIKPNIKRVLIVDDDTNVLDGYRRLFRSQRDHWQVTFCSSGPDALEQLRQQPFDVLVTDMQMPGMNGAELMAQVVEVAPAVARIVLTGYASMTSSVEASDLAHQLLNKPCDVDTLREAIDHSCQIQTMITCDRVKQAIGRVGRLPSPPTVYHELNRALEKDTTDSAVITHIIEQDMAIAAKLLHLVNSAFFGLRRRVASLEQAVSLLGVRQIRDIVLATHVFEGFPKTKNGNGLNLERLREHSVAVGKLARSIMLEEGGSRDLADQAFVGGLLHSFGMLVLAANGFEKYNKAVDYCHRKNRTLAEVEKVLFGVTHPEAGAYILGLWKIPPVIVEAVLMHQNPSVLPSANWSPLSAVHVADALLHEFENSSAPYPGVAVDQAYLEKLGLTSRLGVWRLLAQAQLESADQNDD